MANGSKFVISIQSVHVDLDLMMKLDVKQVIVLTGNGKKYAKQIPLAIAVLCHRVKLDARLENALMGNGS